MARNRFELEENRKKDALEAVINAAKAGAAYLEPAKATVQKNQSKKTAAKSTGSAKTAAAGGKSTRTAQANPVRAAAVNANQTAARPVPQAAAPASSRGMMRSSRRFYSPKRPEYSRSSVQRW